MPLLQFSVQNYNFFHIPPNIYTKKSHYFILFQLGIAYIKEITYLCNGKSMPLFIH